MFKLRKSIWFALICTTLFVVTIMFSVDVISTESTTITAMEVNKSRIIQYASKNNILPATLTGTSVIESFCEFTADGWGNDMIYQVDGSGMVSLTSLGRDKKPGGNGKNLDIVGVFPSRQPNGEWSDENVDWIQNPIDSIQKK